MPSTNNILLLGAVALGALPLSAAWPARSVATVLKGRQVESYNGCSADQQKKLEQDFADAASIANYAVGTLTTDKNAYKNYLRDEDKEHAENMWSAIELNNTPDDSNHQGTGYKFSVTCAAADDTECKDRTTESFAITDAKPQDGDTAREMKICSKYFTDDLTKRSTTDKVYKPNPKRTDNSWCTPAPYKLSDFMVGGVTLLHEMTHLDIVGVRAGYPSFHDDDGNFDYHGTQDIDDLEPQNNPPQQARNLMTLWRDHKNVDGTVEPYHSAENIAASAFEWYIIDLCQYPDNMPV
ncbi:hypothetical protein F5Y19DRAFT_461163 [Xylariaceae sp. FL1651]|nr:hypothetical protein F5Y19DRAFT_461163 [Xylariaceae sp. FL1651]